MAAEQLADTFPPVDFGIVPHNDYWPAEVRKKVAEEPADFLLPNVMRIEAKIKPHPPPYGAYRNAGNGGDLFAPVMMAVDGGFPFGRPRLADIGDQLKPRFVGEYDMGAQPRGVFFIRGHSCRFQRLISFSSRSRARRSGF